MQWTLSRWTSRDLCKAGGPALQDLGYRNPLSLFFKDDQEVMAAGIRTALGLEGGCVTSPRFAAALAHLCEHSITHEPALIAVVLCRLAVTDHYHALVTP